jgi:hypothetical protein
MKVRLTQNGNEIEVNESVGRLLIAQDYATELVATEPEPIAVSPNHRRPVRLESQDREDHPERYILRDSLAQAGVPLRAADILALEFDIVRTYLRGELARIESLEKRLATLEAGTPPHLSTVERR